MPADGRRGCLAGSLGGHFGGRVRRRGCAGVSLGAGRARIRARAAAGTVHSPGTPRHAELRRSPVAARSEWRRATTPDTQSAPAMPPHSREIAAMRSSRRNRGVGEKSPNSGCRPECSMRPPCERARQELSSRRTVPSHEGKRFPSRQVRRRSHKSVRANRREPDVPLEREEPHLSGCGESIAGAQLRMSFASSIAGCYRRVHVDLLARLSLAGTHRLFMRKKYDCVNAERSARSPVASPGTPRAHRFPRRHRRAVIGRRIQ